MKTATNNAEALLRLAQQQMQGHRLGQLIKAANTKLVERIARL